MVAGMDMKNDRTTTISQALVSDDRIKDQYVLRSRRFFTTRKVGIVPALKKRVIIIIVLKIRYPGTLVLVIAYAKDRVTIRFNTVPTTVMNTVLLNELRKLGVERMYR